MGFRRQLILFHIKEFIVYYLSVWMFYIKKNCDHVQKPCLKADGLHLKLKPRKKPDRSLYQHKRCWCSDHPLRLSDRLLYTLTKFQLVLVEPADFQTVWAQLKIGPVVSWRILIGLYLYCL